jgi:hypothetical protein
MAPAPGINHPLQIDEVEGRSCAVAEDRLLLKVCQTVLNSVKQYHYSTLKTSFASRRGMTRAILDHIGSSATSPVYASCQSWAKFNFFNPLLGDK